MSEWNEDDPELEQKADIEEPNRVQEDDFYGNQQIYNSRLDDYEKDMNCEYISEEEREYAKQQYNEVYIEKRDAIDKWKEKYGQYDEERTELRIGENKSEEIEEQESYEIEEQVLEGGFQESQTADIEIAEQNETNFENLSYEELVEKYKGNCAHDIALGDQYSLYDKQISEISRDKAYYSSEKEWNSYIDEKINAQNDVSVRRSQIQSEMRRLEIEMDRRKI